MRNILQNLANMLKVKTIVTLSVIAVFIISRCGERSARTIL